MGTLVWWDMQTAPPPPNVGFVDHLLASHHAMHTGLFRLAPPRILRAHGNRPLSGEAHRCIVKRDLVLQQSISNGDCEHAMVVDMLLWAVDRAPEKLQTDVIVISALVDGGAMADVVKQLHLRNFNVVVASSFPPKDMTPLPRRQSFCDEALGSAPSHETLVLRCRSLVEECLRTGISAFAENDFRAVYRNRYADSIMRREINLEAFLRELCVPGVSFRSVVLGTRPWILCTPVRSGDSSRCLIQEMRVRQSALIADMARATARPPVAHDDEYGALTMKEVSGWLEELVACGRADAGVNLSLLGKDFEERHGGKKLNHKSLHCPTLTALISKFETIVRMERRDSIVILFPSNQLQIKRVTCTSIPRIVQVPGQISIRKNIAPVPKFSSKHEPAGERNLPVANRERFFECREYLLPKEETPAPAANPKPHSPPQISSDPVNVASSAAASDRNADQTPTPAANPRPYPSPLISSVASDPVNVASSAAASDRNVGQTPTPAAKPRPDPSPLISSVASDPVNVVSSAAASDKNADHTPTPAANPRPDPSPPLSSVASDPVIVASPAAASDSNMDHLPNVDPTVKPPPLTLPDFGAANLETNGGQKFDFYSSQVVREREAIKRTFQSVKRRLQEEFKKRKLADNNDNNTA